MDPDLYLRFIVALIFVLALLGGFYLLARRISQRGIGIGGGPRLAVMEARSVDTRRRLVLVRRDDREHLLLIGGGADLLIEKDIPIPATNTIAPPAPEPASSGGLAARIAGLPRG